MKKRACLIVFLLIASLSSLFAAETFYKQMGGLFLVNLAKGYFPSHSDKVEWGGNSADKYNDEVLIGVLGIRNAESDVTISAELTSGDWAYRLDPSDSSISRPFGIDLILRGNGDITIKYDNSNVVHLGIQSEDLIGEKEQSFTIPFKLYTEDDYPTEKYASYEDYKSSVEYDNAILYDRTISSFTTETVWMDVCLVLPTLESDMLTVTDKDGKSKTYIAKTSDTPYKATLKLTISGGGLKQEETVQLDLTGLYSNEEVSETAEILTVSPNASATSIDIVNDYEKSIDIATYSYETKSYNQTYYGNNKNSYIFLSSSKDYTSSSGVFKLRLINSKGNTSTNDSDENSVQFVATITSNNDYGTKVFTGKEQYNSSDTDSLLKISPTTMTAQTGGGSWVRWYDSGTISIQLGTSDSTGSITSPSAEYIDGMMGGKYTSTIYVHVVCPY